MYLSFYKTYYRLMWPKYAWSLWCHIFSNFQCIYNILYSSTVEVLRRWCLYSSIPLYHTHFKIYSAINLIPSSRLHATTTTAEEQWGCSNVAVAIDHHHHHHHHHIPVYHRRLAIERVSFTESKVWQKLLQTLLVHAPMHNRKSIKISGQTNILKLL